LAGNNSDHPTLLVKPDNVEGNKSAFHPKGMNIFVGKRKNHAAIGTEKFSVGQPLGFLNQTGGDFETIRIIVNGNGDIFGSAEKKKKEND